MKKLFIIVGIILLSLALLNGCLGAQKIPLTVTIDWSDEEYYTDSSQYYLGWVVGTYSTTLGNIPEEGITSIKINPDVSEYSLEVPDPVGENVTVFVFQDKNSNGKYDKSSDQLFDSDWVEGSTMTLDVYY